MSVTHLDPEFADAVAQALHRVSAREFGPVEADHPVSDLGLDSISIVELIAMLEDSYDITIDVTEMKNVRTFGDLQDLVMRLRAAR